MSCCRLALTFECASVEKNDVIECNGAPVCRFVCTLLKSWCIMQPGLIIKFNFLMASRSEIFPTMSCLWRHMEFLVPSLGSCSFCVCWIMRMRWDQGSCRATEILHGESAVDYSFSMAKGAHGYNLFVQKVDAVVFKSLVQYFKCLFMTYTILNNEAQSNMCYL